MKKSVLLFLTTAQLAIAGSFTVSSLDGGDGFGTFRRAIDDVNNTGDASNTITFTAEGIITLDAPTSTLTQSVTITGLGAGKSIIKAPFGRKVITSAADTSVTLKDLTLEATGLNFSPQDGGAIFSLGNLTLRNCHIHQFVGKQGGAIFCDKTLTITSCSINENWSSNQGGAILCRGTFLLKNSTFSGNVAANQGGALWLDSSAIGIINQCTIVNNRSGHGAAGIGTIAGRYELSSSIVSQNTQTDSILEPLQISGGNQFTGINFIGGDPELRPLRFYEHPLPYHLPHVNSPASTLIKRNT